MSAISEPRTIEEMHARIRAARARAEAAARHHEEQKLRRAVITEEARAEAAARHHEEQKLRRAVITEEARAEAVEQAADAERRAADWADLNAQVHAVLDPAWLARQPKRIIAQVAANHGVTVGDITGRSVRKAIVDARYEAIRAVAEAHPNLSTPQLGAIFGGRDHTTILYALRRIGLRVAPAPIPTEPAPPGSPEAILQDVAREHGISVRQIRGRSRKIEAVTARHAAMIAIAKAHPGLSSVAIGRLVNRDHTVVLTVLRRAGVRTAPAGQGMGGMSLAQARESGRVPAAGGAR